MKKTLQFCKYLCISVFMLLVTTSSFAGTFYVSSYGSDQNNGSIDYPLLTIQKAVDTASAGDVIHLQDYINLYSPVAITKSLTLEGSQNQLYADYDWVLYYQTPSIFEISTDNLNITIRNINFSAYYSNLSSAIQNNSNSTISIEKCNFNYIPIISSSGMLNIKNCIFYGTKVEAKNANIVNNTFKENGDTAIYLTDGSQSVIYNNIIIDHKEAIISKNPAQEISYNCLFNIVWADFIGKANNFYEDPKLNYYDNTPMNPNCVKTGKNKEDLGAVPVGNCYRNFKFNIDNNNNAISVEALGDTTSVGLDFWDFGDYSNYSYDYFKTNHTYQSSGIYDVTLYTYESENCAAEITKTLIVGDVPLRDPYFYTNESNTDPKTIYFQLNGEVPSDFANVTKYSWDFGDGSISNNPYIKHTYTQEKTYNVCLTTFDANNKFKKYCEPVTIGYNDCYLGFYIDTIEPALHTVKFIPVNNSQARGLKSGLMGPFKFNWNFGDGSYSNEESPTHLYQKGYYTAYVYIVDTISGCSGFFYYFVQIGQLDCKADFELAGDAESKTIYISNKSIAPEGNYYWYFDDGDYSDEKDPVKSFIKGGIHTIGLIVWDNEGVCWDYIEKEIQLGSVECMAKFTYVVDGNTVTCKNESSGNNLFYFWNLGNGTYSIEQDPEYTYSVAGYRTVGLTVYNFDNHCMDYFEETFLVGDNSQDCEAAFIYRVDNSNNVVTFSNKSLGNPVDYIWDFGDGTISFDQNPSKTYSTTGYYNVCLSILNDQGYPDISCKLVQVGADNCKADFAYTIQDKKAYFTDNSIGSSLTYKWDLGDNTASTLIEPDHSYATDDYYLVKLKIKDQNGCESSAYKLLNINMPDTLVARFGYEAKPKATKAGGYPVDFVGTSDGDQARLKWEFGDDSTNTTTNTPTHEYETPGSYYVCVTYEDPLTSAKSEYCQWTSTATDVPTLNHTSVKVFPNPLSDKLQLIYPIEESGLAEVSLFDLSGKKIKILEQSYQLSGMVTAAYDVKSLPSGSYILQVRTKDGILNQLVVKK